MEFGLGLPVSAPERLLEWARAAETEGFASLALLDRLVYDNPEPLTALAVLAGATSRIRLQTEVLLAPLRGTALLAKQVATLDRMSGGRFVLGVGVGGRDDDFRAADVRLTQRGRILDTQLAALRQIWRGEPWPDATPPGATQRDTAPPDATRPDATQRDTARSGATPPGATQRDTARPGATRPGAAERDALTQRNAKIRPGGIGPRPATLGGPRILIGGFAPAALRRVALYGDGFLCAAPLAWAGGLVQTVREQWAEAGRAGKPRLVCQINVAVAPAVAQARAAIADYYAFTGRAGWGEPLSDPAEIADTVAAYREFGADELIMYCYGEDPRQVAALSAIVR